MEPKDRLKRQLEEVRKVSEGYLQSFETPQQWTHQVFPGANHALWFAGHMAMTDDFFADAVDKGRAVEKEGYSELFGMGSKPVDDASKYPPPEEVLGFMRERRQTLLAALDGLSADDLARPTTEGTPDFLPDVASVFEMATWHEALHAGQISVVRRALGEKPLMG